MRRLGRLPRVESSRDCGIMWRVLLCATAVGGKVDGRFSLLHRGRVGGKVSSLNFFKRFSKIVPSKDFNLDSPGREEHKLKSLVITKKISPANAYRCLKLLISLCWVFASTNTQQAIPIHQT